MSNAKAPKPAAAPPAESAAAPAKKKPVLLLAVVGVVLLGGLGAGGWFLAGHFLGKPAPAEAKAKVEEPVKATVPLGGVVVNLAGETRRYLRVAISLGVASPKEAKEVEESKPQLLDLFISALSATEVEALMSEDERVELKESLLQRIHAELGLKKVSRIYFTEFVIQ